MIVFLLVLILVALLGGADLLVSLLFLGFWIALFVGALTTFVFLFG